MNNYVRIPKIHKKTKQAEEEFRSIYISGATGYGKTASVKYYFRHKALLELSGKTGELPEKPEIKSIRQGIVLIDDLSWIQDEESIDYILELLRHSGKQIILIGRGAVPEWLEGTGIQMSMLQAGERDLAFDEEATQTYFSQSKVPLEEQDIRLIMNMTKGYPLATVLLLRHIQMGEPLMASTLEAVRFEVYRYFDNVVFECWNEKVRKMLLALCPYESFTTGIATQLTGESGVPDMLEYCRNIGDFLYNQSEQCYYLRPYLRKFLLWKRPFLYTEEEEKENHRRAALSYELHGGMEKALEYYHEAGASEKIRDILIKNARLHPGLGDYFAMRKYYQFLPGDHRHHQYHRRNGECNWRLECSRDRWR
jgi:LuxR family maltose regulon positive regulatory protein